MAKRPPEDPRITDLRRYRKAREQARRQPPPRPPAQGLLGSNRYAGLILAALVALVFAFWGLPLILKLL